MRAGFYSEYMELQSKLDVFASAFMSAWAADIKSPDPQRVSEVSYNIAEAMVAESHRRMMVNREKQEIDQDKLEQFAIEFMKTWASDIPNPHPDRVAKVSFDIAEAMVRESEARMSKIRENLNPTPPKTDG